MVALTSVLPPWLDVPLRRALALRSAHALLLHGPDGNAQFDLAIALAQALLCETSDQSVRLIGACGACPGCRLVEVRTHPDLLSLVPDSMREALGWPAADSESPSGASVPKAKPSNEIRVDDAREAVTFAQTTSARGRGRVVLVHPAESMNDIAANALLKTLEEPPGTTRFILSTHAAGSLLPTIRSRCSGIMVGLPAPENALEWLSTNGVAEPAVLLRAAGGRPQEALEWSRTGFGSAHWLELPGLAAQGRVDNFAQCPLPRLIRMLQKICHDCMCVAVAAPPRYFPAKSLTMSADLPRLTAWAVALRRHAEQADHPWQAALKTDALIREAQRALQSAEGQDRAQLRSAKGRASIHSRP